MNNLNNNNNNNNETIGNENETYPIIRNCMVEVLPRTWPGINKPGGAARVTQCHYRNSTVTTPRTSTTDACPIIPNHTNDASMSPFPFPFPSPSPVVTHVDVRYVVMGGFERNVPIEYCHPAPQYDESYQAQLRMRLSNSNNKDTVNGIHERCSIPSGGDRRILLRDRSTLKGRCKRCGSLRNDCGSCDWRFEEEEAVARTREKLVLQKSQEANEEKDKEEEKEEQSQNLEKVVDRIKTTNKRNSNNTLKQRHKRQRRRVNTKTNQRKVQSTNEQKEEALGPFSTTKSSMLLSSSSSSSSSSDDSLTLYQYAFRKFKSHKHNHHRPQPPSSSQQQQQEKSSAFPSDSSSMSESNALTSSDDDDDDFYYLEERIRKLGPRYESQSKRFEAQKQHFDQGTERSSNDHDGKSRSKKGSKTTIVDTTTTTTTTTATTRKGVEGPNNSANTVTDRIAPHNHQHDVSMLENLKVNTTATIPSQEENDIISIHDNNNDDKSDDDDDDDDDDPTTTQEYEFTNNEEQLYNPHQNNPTTTTTTTAAAVSSIEKENEDDKLFIQPEGEEAAENLPSDIVDLTLGLSYSELPDFFNRIVSELEDDKIPRAESDIRDLARSIEEARCDVESNDGVNRRERLKALEDQSVTTHDNLLKELVRDGIDQCGSALKRLLNRRAFREARKEDRGMNLNWAQIEAMDLRHESVNGQVETVIRKARQILDVLLSISGLAQDRIGISDDDDDDSSGVGEVGDGDSIGNVASQELSDGSQQNSYCVSEFTMEAGDKRLSCETPFDPHQYAYTRRSGERRIQRQAQKQQRLRQKRRKRSSRAGIAHTTTKESSLSSPPSSFTTYPGESFEQAGMKRKKRQRSKRNQKVRNRKVKRKSNSSHNELPEGDLDDSSQEEQHENESETFSYESPSTPGTLLSTSRSSGRAVESQQARRKRQKKRQRHKTVSSTNITERESAFFQEDVLFHTENVSMTDENETQVSNEDIGPLPTVCEKLRKCYLTDKDHAMDLLHALPHFFENTEGVDTGGTRDKALIVFHTITELLQMNGYSLLEMIQTSNDNFFLHVKLLICISRLLGLNVQSVLSCDDGPMLHVFRIAGKCSIIESTILQMIDILYSQILPDEWGSPRPVNQEVRNELIMLRGALCRITHVIEDVSRLLVQRFRPQKWRRSEFKCQNPWFVSSIDTIQLVDSWKGKIAQKGAIRLAGFNKTYPRTEINSLWSILAFFNTKADVDSTSTIRWKLISSLFTSQAGVLGNQNSRKKMCAKYSSKSQIERCAIEIRHFCTLLSSGALEPNMLDNGIIFKLVQRSIFLDVDGFVDKSMNGFHYLKNVMQKKEVRFIFELWKETELSSGLSHQSILTENLFTDAISYPPLTEAMNVFSLSPPTNVVRSSLSLISIWISRFPNKKARWSRLKDSVSVLIDDFVKSSNKLKEQSDFGRHDVSSDGDDFARSFNSSSSPKLYGSSFSASWITQRNNAASILMTTEYAQAANKLSPYERRDSFQREFCERIWGLVSNDSSALYQKTISSTEGWNGNITGKCEPLYSSFSALRIMSTLMLHYLNIMKQREKGKKGGEQFNDQGTLEFIVSCILACMISVCQLHIAVNEHGQLFHTSSMRQSLLQIMDSDSVLCVNVLSTGFCWLSCIFSRIRSILLHLHRTEVVNDSFAKRMIKMTTPVVIKCLPQILVQDLGLSSDTSFRACLALVRSILALFDLPNENEDSTMNTENGNTNNETERVNVPGIEINEEEEDMMEGIDDEALMEIDLESIMTSSANNQTRNVATEESSYQKHCTTLFLYLLQALEISKPSLRYRLAKSSSGFDQQGDNSISASGKAICGRHAGGICLVLAALCTQTNVKCETLLDSHLFQPPKTDLGNLSTKNDITYFKHIGQCFSVELCKLARSSQLCLSLLADLLPAIFTKCLEAILDASVLNRFPTVNADILLTVGGGRSHEKEGNRLKGINRKAKEAMNEDEGNPDNEAAGIKKQKNDFVDSPGPSYMCSRLWSFCTDLGNACVGLSASARYDDGFQRRLKLIGITLKARFEELLDPVQMNCTKSLNQIAIASLERECLKRTVRLQAIFAAVMTGQNENSTGDMGPHGVFEEERFVSFLIKSFLEELDSIALGVQYYENNEKYEDVHVQAKARSLQSAYTLLTMSIFMCFLRESSLSNSQATMQTQFICDFIILPSLKLRGYDTSMSMKRSSMEISRSSNLAVVPFDIFPEVKCNHGNSPATIANDMLMALNCFVGELPLIFTSGQLKSSGRTLMYELMNSAINTSDRNESESAVTVNIASALVTGDDISCSENILSESLMNYMSAISTSDGSIQKKMNEAVSYYRKYAIHSVMVPKLMHKAFSIEKKGRILEILETMLLFSCSSNRNKEERAYFQITPDNEDSGFLNFHGDCCQIINALACCLLNWLESPTHNEVVIQRIFQCSTCLLTLRVKNTKKNLLQWCQYEAQQNNSVIYFNVTMTWLNKITAFLNKESWGSFLDYINFTKGMESINHEELKGRYKSDILFKQFERWQSLTDEKKGLEQILFSGTGNSMSGVGNVYSMKITSSNKHTVPNLGPETIRIADDFMIAFLSR